MNADSLCTKRHCFIRKLTLHVSAFQSFPLIWQIFIILFKFWPRYLHNIQPAHPYTFCCFFHKYIKNKQWVMHNWKTNHDHLIKWKHFHVVGLLWGFPLQRPMTRGFDVFFDLRLKKCWANNRDAVDLRRHPSHYDVTVLCIFQFKRDRWKHGWMNGPIVGWVGEWLDVMMDGWMGRDRDTLYKSQIMDDSSSADIQINSAQILHAVIFSMPWRLQMETFSASLALCAGN